ncbi:MAG: hypothetical protein PHI12_01085 [Dehalococcoidales bacterium]|nr:hypothetical protein [Dehalococcoidales bacterium]
MTIAIIRFLPVWRLIRPFPSFSPIIYYPASDVPVGGMLRFGTRWYIVGAGLCLTKATPVLKVSINEFVKQGKVD